MLVAYELVLGQVFCNDDDVIIVRGSFKTSDIYVHVHKIRA